MESVVFDVAGSEPEELFETISQSLMNAVDRDCLSGWGAEVTVITPDKIITRTLRTRQVHQKLSQ
ncbi:Proteasome subunit beta type-3 [Lobosporangium transversale]|nr:Proteasome subunit beta type-3 [Lobosporangium transversale]